MGANPLNFPPQIALPVGITSSVKNITNVSLATTAFFTCQVPGVYMVVGSVVINATDLTGTLNVTASCTSVGLLSTSAVSLSGLQTFIPGRAIWMNAGDTVTVSTTAAGLTATTYSIYLNVTSATGPNPPPGTPAPLGVTNSFLNQNGSIPTTTIFVAPATGLYAINAATHLLATDGAGTLTVTWNSSAVASGPFAATPTLSTATDGTTNMRSLWMTAGQTVTIQATAAGVTGTTYNVFVSVIQLL